MLKCLFLATISFLPRRKPYRCCTKGRSTRSPVPPRVSAVRIQLYYELRKIQVVSLLLESLLCVLNKGLSSLNRGLRARSSEPWCIFVPTKTLTDPSFEEIHSGQGDGHSVFISRCHVITTFPLNPLRHIFPRAQFS